MMPQLVRVRVKGREGRGVRLWIPLLPVLLIFSPLLVIAGLVAAIACVVYRVNPFRVLATGWRIWSALTGTRIDIQQGGTAVLVQIS